MKFRTYILAILVFQAACGFMGSAVADPCKEMMTAKSASLKLTRKSIETVLGITELMGTFEVENHGDAPIVLGAYKDKNGFSLWRPDARLERRLPDGSWGNLSDSYGDTLPAPETLTIKGHSTQQFLARIQSEDSSVTPTTELRIVVQSRIPGSCMVSDPFTSAASKQ